MSDTGRRVAGWVSGGASGFARGLYAGARWPDHRVGEVQRRTVRSLVVSQALGGLGMSIGIAVRQRLGDRAPAQVGDHLLVGPAAGIAPAEGVLHPRPELRVPHGAERTSAHPHDTSCRWCSTSCRW